MFLQFEIMCKEMYLDGVAHRFWSLCGTAYSGHEVTLVFLFGMFMRSHAVSIHDVSDVSKDRQQ